MIVKKFGENLTIHRLTSEADRQRWRPGFVGAYQAIFEGAPYNERFSAETAEGQFRKLSHSPGNIVLVVTNPAQDVVGIAAAVPVRAMASVARELSGLIPLSHTMYLAELGVLPGSRGKGLGRELVMQRMRLTPADQFTHMVVRVSARRHASFEMYRSLGFEDMGAYMEVSSLRTNGQVRTDRRLFLSKVLSQVKLDG